MIDLFSLLRSETIHHLDARALKSERLAFQSCSVCSRYIVRVVYVRANSFLTHQNRYPSLGLQFYKDEGVSEWF